MLLGLLAALGPDIFRAMRGEFGDYAYAHAMLNGRQYSTAFLNVVAYFDVGRGKLVGAAGMVASTLLYRLWTLWQRHRSQTGALTTFN